MLADVELQQGVASEALVGCLAARCPRLAVPFVVVVVVFASSVNFCPGRPPSNTHAHPLAHSLWTWTYW
jgi:hypothetical protein